MKRRERVAAGGLKEGAVAGATSLLMEARL